MTRRRSLVVLGGADGSVSLYLRARELGLHTICVDFRDTAPAVAVADEFVPESVREPERIAAALRGRDDLVGVVCPASDVGLPAQAWLTRHWGLPHPLSPAAVAASVDKPVFRDLLESLDLPRYRSVAGEPGAELVVRAAALRFPVLVKPVDASGSRGVEQIGDVAGLPGAFSRAARFSACGRVIVEEFVTGRPLSVEALIVDGEVAFHAVTRRTVTPPPLWVTTSHRTPAGLPAAVDDLLAQQLGAVCSALGHRNGPLTADAVLAEDGELYLIEIAARPGGNGLAELVRSAYGVDLIEATLALATGDVPTLRPRRPRHRVALMLTAGSDGRVLGVEGVERVRTMACVERFHLFAVPGTPVHRYEQAGDKLGYLVLRADSAADLRRAEREVERTLAFRIGVADDVLLDDAPVG
jgi:biotin carboxylase